MKRALAVVEGTDATKEIVRQAGEFTDAVGAELLLLHVTSEEEFADRAEALASIPDVTAQYNVEQAAEGAREFAADVGREVLGADGYFEAVGKLGETKEEVLSVAAERDCDHIFISGPERSPTGKALFGDTAQQVILEFDGPVTVLTA